MEQGPGTTAAIPSTTREPQDNSLKEYFVDFFSIMEKRTHFRVFEALCNHGHYLSTLHRFNLLHIGGWIPFSSPGSTPPFYFMHTHENQKITCQLSPFTM